MALCSESHRVVISRAATRTEAGRSATVDVPVAGSRRKAVCLNTSRDLVAMSPVIPPAMERSMHHSESDLMRLTSGAVVSYGALAVCTQ